MRFNSLLISLVHCSFLNCHCQLIPIPILQEVGDVCNEIETCVEGTFCDPVDGLCSCPDPASQIFDTFRKKCVAQVDEGCVSSEDCTQFAGCLLQWNQTLGRFRGRCVCTGRYFKLPFESICGPRSKFREPCNEHVNDINFQPCDVTQNLRCKGGLRNGIPYGSCVCENDVTHVYDEHKRACVIRAGQSCFSQRTNSAGSICVYGAKCLHFVPNQGAKKGDKVLASNREKGQRSSGQGSAVPPSMSSKMKSASKEFGSHSQASSGNSGSLRCRCEAGFSKTADGFCKPSFGGRCDDRHECISHSGLICSDGECQCESPLYQIFDERSNKCLCKVGSSCYKLRQGHGHGQGHHYCVRHAHCHANEPHEDDGDGSATTLLPTVTSASPEGQGQERGQSSHQGHCKCNQGFSKTLDGQCKLDFGMNCSTSLNSNFQIFLAPDPLNSAGMHHHHGVDCNNDAGLACQNGKCVCFDAKLVFEEGARICVNHFDEFCGAYKDEGSGVKYRVGCKNTNN